MPVHRKFVLYGPLNGRPLVLIGVRDELSARVASGVEALWRAGCIARRGLSGEGTRIKGPME